ncbi:MAG: glycoside hydrolase family 13 protein [Verrucomicrobiota bacterium]
MTKRLFWLPALFLASAAAAAPYQIQHLEPLHWWVGMKHPELQLLVHGENIADLVPEIRYPGVTLVDVQRTRRANFLFINLLIAPDTVPGTFDIRFKRGDRVVTQAAYRLEARRKDSAERRGFDASDAIYLIVPDRFANGNPANDSQPHLAEQAVRSNPSGRHGGDLRGMREQLDYVADLGFTMIWPTPLLENNQERYSYHGYSITDHYRIDARFGTNEEYRDYVRAAKERQLGIIQDIVLNHIGTGHWWMKDPPADDWLNHQQGFVPTNNRHSTVMDIHAAPEEREQFLNGWFVETMPDLNQRNPLVARYLIQNTLWWIEYADLSGVRQDTYSYADPEFLARWSTTVMEEYPRFNIVGEEMDPRPFLVAYWQKGVRNRDGYASGLPSVMDFPIVDLMPSVLNDAETYATGLSQLYEAVAADFLYADPMKLLVFPDNHDRPRLYSRLHENLDLLETSLLFTATTRGIPQYFYGTEVLITSPVERNDGLLRADMPGGWPGDRINAFTGAGLTPKQQEAQNYLRKLLNWRKTSTAVASGKLLHYIPQEGLYVYFRYDDNQTVMVVLNKSPKDTELDLSRFRRMLKGAKAGRNVLTTDAVDLTVPLRLKALKSVAIEW